MGRGLHGDLHGVVVRISIGGWAGRRAPQHMLSFLPLQLMEGIGAMFNQLQSQS